MEIKKGYKQTEVGVIPYDWNLEELGKCLLSHPKYGIGAPACNYNDSLPTYLRITDISEDGKFIHENKSSVNNTNSHEYILENGEIVFARTGASVGKSYLYNNSDGILIYAGFLIKVKPDPSKLNSYFLKSIVTTKNYWNWIGMVSMRSGQPGINSNQLSSFILPIPSLKEQTAIAQALSDAEAYITSLEKLIEKKRQIQQGAKQELLKPKDGWEIKSLGDIGKTFGGLSGKSKDDFNEGVYPYIPFMNIMSNPIIDIEYFDYVNLNSGESQNLAIKGDLFFNGSSETPEEVGMCSVLLNDIPNLYLNSFCFGFRIKSELKLNGLYLSYYFRSKEGRKLFYSMAQGATRYNLSKSNFNKLKIPIPTIEEQNEIAERLFDLDSDIKIHEVKLSKAKSIKQGMMQNLLTGKIRLI
jgi:type I restriction enzyme S subunit